MGFKPTTGQQQITDPSEQDFIPATRLNEAEFDDLLRSKGLKP